MRNTSLRILDANANRAREAMRILEDAARFLLDDQKLTGEWKRLRHRHAQTMQLLQSFVPSLELQRNTPEDVGTTLTTQSERQRFCSRDIVTAAGKRLTEALRCLEEYAKPFCESAAEHFQDCRYHAYDLEKKTLLCMCSGRAAQWRLAVILTESLCEHHSWLDVARAALDGGADCLQIREKTLEGGEFLDRALRLADLTNEFGRKRNAWNGSLIVNDRPDIALMAWTNGVHLGQNDPPIDRVRSILPTDRIIGVSTHNMQEARRAVKAGADYCGVGPIFPSKTKPSRKSAGLVYLKKFIDAYPHQPHLAIGGITPDNCAEVVDAGARGVAVSAIVCGAKKPVTVVRKLLRCIPK